MVFRALLTYIQSKYSNKQVQYGIGIFIILFFTISYSLLQLHKYWQLEYFFTDNVYFHSALWKLSQFKTPIVTHAKLGQINIFGDHFHPTIILFSLLLKIVPKHEIIFIGMSVVFALSSVTAMHLGFKLLKSRFATYCLLIAYFTYLGLQYAMLAGFHEQFLMPLFFLLAMYGIIDQKMLVYWLSLVLLLLTKETNAVVAITIGIFIFLVVPKHRKVGLITIAVSAGYYFFVTKIVIPFFSHAPYLYESVRIPNTLNNWLIKLFGHPDKIETIVVSLLTFALLPVLNLATLPMILQDILGRFIFSITGSIQYRLTYHYGVALVPILFFSSLWTLYNIQKKKIHPKLIPLLAILILGFSFYYYRFYPMKGPLALVYNRDFYALTEKNKFLWELIDKTPREGKIMTQNHLGLPLAQYDIYPFPANPERPKYFQSVDPDYIVYDLREGQNPNNYFPLSEENFIFFVNHLQKSGHYKIYFEKGSLFILQKTHMN